MNAEVRSRIVRGHTTSRETLLPAAGVVVEEGPLRSRHRGDKGSRVTNPTGRAPHEIGIGRLVQELDDVTPLVGQERDTDQFILQRDRT